MKNAMTLFGCGPKLALLSMPYIILASAIMIMYPEFLNLEFISSPFFRIAGIVWLFLGITFWGYSAFYFLKYFKPGKLITTGPFGLCRNPIYSSIIAFIIPALGIIFHSGLIISVAVVLYIGFSISIHGEASVLRKIFGEEYNAYEKSVNEFFPFPKNKIQRYIN